MPCALHVACVLGRLENFSAAAVPQPLNSHFATEKGVNCNSPESSWHIVWHQSARESGGLTLKSTLRLVKELQEHKILERQEALSYGMTEIE